MNVDLTPDEIRELLYGRASIFSLPTSKERLRRSSYAKLRAALDADEVSHQLLADEFHDERGSILDLIQGPIDAVTRIFTAEGAVRGNHYHRLTTQWTYVLSGTLLVAYGNEEKIIAARGITVEEPGVPHAWKALEDTDVLVFTHGPRSGQNYETDTVRLETPLIQPESLLDGNWETLARVEWENWRLEDDRAP